MSGIKVMLFGKKSRLAHWSYRSPDWCSFSLLGVAGGKQHVDLVRLKDVFRAVALRPSLESTLRKTLLGKPKSTTVIIEQANRGSAAIAEDEDGTGEWILVKFLST